MSRICVVVLIVCVGAVLIASCRGEAQEAAMRQRPNHQGQLEPKAPIDEGKFDGRWWQGVSSDERKGFLAGTDDCLTYDLHSGLSFSGSQDDAEKRVTLFYHRSSQNLAVPVFRVFRNVGKTKKRIA